MNSMIILEEILVHNQCKNSGSKFLQVLQVSLYGLLEKIVYESRKQSLEACLDQLLKDFLEESVKEFLEKLLEESLEDI